MSLTDKEKRIIIAGLAELGLTLTKLEEKQEVSRIITKIQSL